MTLSPDWIEAYQNIQIPIEGVNKVGDWLVTKNVAVSIKIPNCYDNNLPEFDDVEEHERMTQEDIDQHFRDFLDFHDDSCIQFINGTDVQRGIMFPFQVEIECSYCALTDQEMRYCCQCHKSICDSCWEGKTREIHSNHLFEIELKSVPLRVHCNVCKAHSLEVEGEWLCSRVSDLDLCPQCQDFAKNSAESFKRVVSKAPFASFGSYLNWIPLLKHEEYGHMLLYNMVPGSPSYHKVCLVATLQEHGEPFQGFHVVSDKSLSEVIKELKEAKREREETDKDNYHSAAIPYIMDKRGWMAYFDVF